MSPARLKGDWTSWRDKPRVASPGAEQKRKEAEAFAALAEFIRRAGGFVTSPPGKVLRIEIGKDFAAKLTNKLTELGYHVQQCGTATRIVGAGPSDPKTERMTRVVPSPFLEVCVLEIRTDGR